MTASMCAIILMAATLVHVTVDTHWIVMEGIVLV